MPETFEEFRKSFSYGSRSDLSFKFLARFDDQDGGEALRLLFEQTGNLLDDGDPAGLIDSFVAAQAEAYRLQSLPDKYHYEDSPFVIPPPLADARLALLTSSGHFRDGDDPKPFGEEDMTQEEAEARIDDVLRNRPTLSEIPVDAPAERLRVRHGGYDVRGALIDHNVAFPVDRLRDLTTARVIGNLHETAYSFKGATSQGALLKHAAPMWLETLSAAAIDVVLLVPV